MSLFNAPTIATHSHSMPRSRVIYWFRTDLRLHDSPALTAALDLKPEFLYPIWTWDPHYVYRARVGSNRWQFLLDCMSDLSSNISKLNSKSKLHVLREAPQTLFPKLFKAWGITHLVFEKDTDAYARDRDEEVKKIAQKAGVEVIVKYGRTLWDPDELVKANHGHPTMSITQTEAAGAKIGEIPKPLPAPTSLPDPGPLSLDIEQDRPVASPDFNSAYRTSDEGSYASGLSGPNHDFGVPTMEELGLKPSTTPHRGGETLALEVLESITSNATYTATFEKPKTAPTAFAPQSTCLTSPHLHFGTLSVRHFYWRVQAVIDEYEGTASKPPTSLQGQLLFRDMYFGAQAALGWSFAQTHGNEKVRFVPWHLPSKIDTATGLITGEYEVDSQEAEEYFQRWKEGRTGFPWIDALMRQLKTEGWIHHLGRHAVACFLTRGGCYVSWERGAEVFEEWLIDHETACNTGNWQWLSCTAFYAQFYRCYSPIAFPQKWDKEGKFVKHFCPELKDLPAKYIYEPWKAPIQDQRKAKLLVKGNGTEEKEGDLTLYPKPMFDFSKQREICINGLKNAYHVGLYGNSPKVKDGTWKQMFEDSAEGPTEGSKGGPGGMLKFEDAEGPEDEEDVHHDANEKKVTNGRTKSQGLKEETGTRRTRGQAALGGQSMKVASPEEKKGTKRTRGQATLDGQFKKVKK